MDEKQKKREVICGGAKEKSEERKELKEKDEGNGGDMEKRESMRKRR